MSYKDRAIRDYRPSDNVENRARRGMNGTAQRWAIKTQNAERELQRFEDDAPYTEQDVADWLATSGYRGYQGGQDPYNMDLMIRQGKLANATGKGHIVEGYQDVQPVPGITDDLYRAGPAYNGGLEPFAGGGAVRRLRGALSTIERRIPGKPDTVKIPGYGEVYAEPIKEVEQAADSYMRKVGRPDAHRIDAYEDFDEDRAARIAEAFERMQHNPQDPEVKRAYDAMIAETLDQYESLKDAGVDFRFLKEGQSDPYAKSPALGYADTIENGRLWVFPTDQGFGTLNEVADNPLLKRVGRIGDLENATANDAFRAVHDMYGHFGPGNPFFRHKGEERAWDNHSRMYSKDALPAMTTETRGQNSWLNFGPYGEQNRNALGAETVFADQKIGLLPSWAYGEGYAGGGFVNGGNHIANDHDDDTYDDVIKPALQDMWEESVESRHFKPLRIPFPSPAQDKDRKGRYATGGLVGGMEAVDEAQDDLVEPAMFAGKAARGARSILKPKIKEWLTFTPETHPEVRRNIEHHVWERDGVGLNRDGQHMFEIDDSAARLKELPDFGPDPSQFPTKDEYNAASTAWYQAGNKPPVGLKLPDLLDHPELYENYPELASLPLRMNLLDKGHYGALDSFPDYGRKGSLNYMLINRGLEKGDMLDTVLHEAQHGIQTLEGWTPGTGHIEANSLRNQQDRALWNADMTMEAHKLFQQGLDKAGIIAALPEIRNRGPEQLAIMLHDAQKMSLDQIMAMRDNLKRNREQYFDDVHSIYERNEGESMARNTANRRELTMPERRESFWRDSEDRQGEPRFVGPDARLEW